MPFIFVQKEIGFCPIKVIFDKWQHQQCTLSRIRLYSSIYYISLGNFMQIPILVQYRIHCSCSSLKWHVACGYYMWKQPIQYVCVCANMRNPHEICTACLFLSEPCKLQITGKGVRGVGRWGSQFWCLFLRNRFSKPIHLSTLDFICWTKISLWILGAFRTGSPLPYVHQCFLSIDHGCVQFCLTHWCVCMLKQIVRIWSIGGKANVHTIFTS